MRMFEKCWPFPEYDQIVKEFPKENVTPQVYEHAKQFYLESIAVEAAKFLDLMRQKDSDGEQKFASFLVRQAVHVGLGHINKN